MYTGSLEQRVSSEAGRTRPASHIVKTQRSTWDALHDCMGLHPTSVMPNCEATGSVVTPICSLVWADHPIANWAYFIAYRHAFSLVSCTVTLHYPEVDSSWSMHWVVWLPELSLQQRLECNLILDTSVHVGRKTSRVSHNNINTRNASFKKTSSTVLPLWSKICECYEDSAPVIAVEICSIIIITEVAQFLGCPQLEWAGIDWRTVVFLFLKQDCLFSLFVVCTWMGCISGWLLAADIECI